MKVREIVGRKENGPVFRNRCGTADTIENCLSEHIRGLQIKVTGPKTFMAYYVVEEGLEEEKTNIARQQLGQALYDMLKLKQMDNVQKYKLLL